MFQKFLEYLDKFSNLFVDYFRKMNNLVFTYIQKRVDNIINEFNIEYKKAVKNFLWNVDTYWPKMIGGYVQMFYESLLTDYFVITWILAMLFWVFCLLYVLGTWGALISYLGHVKSCLIDFYKEVSEIFKK